MFQFEVVLLAYEIVDAFYDFANMLRDKVRDIPEISRASILVNMLVLCLFNALLPCIYVSILNLSIRNNNAAYTYE